MLKVPVNIEREQLSPELTIVWFWFDRIDENPMFRFGTDENFPECGTYLNGKLVSTVFWKRGALNLDHIMSFLNSASDYQKIPGYHNCQETL